MRVASAVVAISMLGCANVAPRPPEAPAPASDRTGQRMTQSTAALVTAHDALMARFPGRKVGNIVVEPAPETFRVSLVDLPVEGGPAAAGTVIVLVDRKSGEVREVAESRLPSMPDVSGRVPLATISGRQAFDSALVAIKGHETYDKEGKLTVELVAGAYQVTFPLAAANKQPRGADYAFQVWLDPLTAKVIKILVAS
jgi:hypothetical protein